MTTHSINQDANVSYVYLWTSRAAFRSFGHISLELSDGAYISFWPRDDITKSDGVLGTAARWIPSRREDMNLLGYRAPDKTIPVFDLNIVVIRAWLQSYQEKDPEWSLLVNSCSKIVYRALCKGSEVFSKNQKVEGFITTPESVAELVEKGFNKEKKGRIRFGCVCKVK